MQYSESLNALRATMTKHSCDIGSILEGKQELVVDFPVPSHYQYVRRWNQEDWKGIEVKVRHLKKEQTETDGFKDC